MRLVYAGLLQIQVEGIKIDGSGELRKLSSGSSSWGEGVRFDRIVEDRANIRLGPVVVVQLSRHISKWAIWTAGSSSI